MAGVMRKRRITFILLAAVLATAGLMEEVWRVEPPAKVIPVKALRPGQGYDQQISSINEAKYLVHVTRTPATTSERSAPVPDELSGDATALVGEMCDLQLLAQGTGLALDSRQWSMLAAVVLNTQAVRQIYEAEIATATLVAPGQYRVEVPSYASAGDLLRAQFHADLRAKLGEATAGEVLAKLGEKLEGHFAGFGVSLQTIDIAADPRGADTNWQVTRTVTYWNSVDGGDRLTTRRETHFPAWEDPTGERWAALLAVVGT
jgi:hypothetical protein